MTHASKGASALVLLSFLAPLAGAQGKRYTITNVGTGRPGVHLAGAGLSDTGYVAVWQLPSQGPLGSIGYRWSPFGLVRPHPPVGAATLRTVTADAVNDAGTFVGAFGTTPDVWTRGFRWKDGVTEELFTPLGFRAYPLAINSAGTIVGYAGALPGGTPGAVMWNAQLTPSFVADLSLPTDVNDAGQICAYRTVTTGTPAAYLWDAGNLIPIDPLPPAGPGDVFPRALNEHAVVVGHVEIGGFEHAFRWTRSGGTQELPNLGISHFPFNTAARDVNDAGWAIGYAPDELGQTEVLWTPAGTAIELDTLVPDVGPGRRWRSLSVAAAINEAGQISGTAVLDANLQTITVLLTPADLDASALVPGRAGVTNTLEIDAATPGTTVFLAADLDDATDHGYSPISGCEPIGLAMRVPRVVAVSVADAAGHAGFTWNVPAHLAGSTLRLQAWQPGVCELSPIVRVSL